MTVRPAVADDVPAILQLLADTPSLPHWHPTDLARGLADEGGTAVLQRSALVVERARSGDSPAPGAGRGRTDVAAFAQWNVLLDEAELEILVVRQNARRGGLGRLLLRAAMTALHAQGVEVLRLEVRSANRAAAALYASEGFLEVGRRRLYYQNPPDDALLLQRTLKG